MGATFRSRLFLAGVLLGTLPGKADAAASPGCPVNPPTDGSGSVWSVGGEWQDDGGATSQLSAMKGGPAVLAMFYTGCHARCPVAVEAMQWVEHNLPASQARRCRFVLVTLDPSGDTVAELRRFRAEAGLSSQWVLLRGARRQTRELADRLGLGFQVGEYGVSHTSRLIVLDAAGRIVAQQSTAASGLPQLLRQVRRLLGAPAGPDAGRGTVAAGR